MQRTVNLWGVGDQGPWRNAVKHQAIITGRDSSRRGGCCLLFEHKRYEVLVCYTDWGVGEASVLHGLHLLEYKVNIWNQVWRLWGFVEKKDMYM